MKKSQKITEKKVGQQVCQEDVKPWEPDENKNDQEDGK